MISAQNVTISNFLTTSIEYLVIGGGGGGGLGPFSQAGGGGGGGGYRSSVFDQLSGSGSAAETLAFRNKPINIDVVIGAGGAGNSSGSFSSFGDIVAEGGGRGGTATIAGGSGGSGGGGGTDLAGAFLDQRSTAGGAGTSNQGTKGQDGFYTDAPLKPPPITEYPTSGFGGGARLSGDGETVEGNPNQNRGDGLTSNITGTTSVKRSNGGAGCIPQDGIPPGENNPPVDGANGAANTGDGGGGGGGTVTGSGPQGTAGVGGSGIVILRYFGPQKALGGTVTTFGKYTIHTFTSTGTFEWKGKTL